MLRLASKEELPLGKIVCLGRNYVKHANEMGAEVPEVPVFFLKPPSSYVPDGGTIILPEGIGRVEHEIELAVVLARNAREVPERRWKEFVLGYALFLDMTARDVQDAAKRKGDPWALSKSYDTFSPMSLVLDKSKVSDPQALELQLRVNGELRQHGHTKDMIFPVSRALSYLSSIMTLERGDVVATGTPEGVGPVKRGDKLEARIPGLVTLTVKVDERRPRI